MYDRKRREGKKNKPNKLEDRKRREDKKNKPNKLES